MLLYLLCTVKSMYDRLFFERKTQLTVENIIVKNVFKLLPDYQNPHTESIRNSSVLKPFFGKDMFLVKNPRLTIKFISRSIFYKFNKGFGSFYHTKGYIQIVIFIKLIKRHVIYQKQTRRSVLNIQTAEFFQCCFLHKPVYNFSYVRSYYNKFFVRELYSTIC